jgi:hypothetical protein
MEKNDFSEKENEDNKNSINDTTLKTPNKCDSSKKKIFLNGINGKKNSSEKSFNSSGTYIGSFINNKKNGKGKLIVPDHFVYEGNFKDDLFDGYGEYISKQYNYYGNYLCGKKDGKGKEIDLIKNIEYEGDFKDDKKNGFGKEKTADGSIYIGDFKDNKKHGQGTLLLNGIKTWSYKGQFKNDKISGMGRFRWNKNMEYIGEWENSELSGYGFLIKDNIRHIGYFSHNYKQGYGASFYYGKYAILGKWEKDVIEGISVLIILTDLERSNNDDKEDNFKIVKTSKGEIAETNLDNDEINEYKSSQEYNNMVLLYKKKIYPDFLHIIEKNNVEDSESNNEDYSG